MAQYYFNLRNGVDVLIDPDGRDLAGIDLVNEIALREARALISHDALAGHIQLDQRIEVQDYEGTVVCVIEFVDAVDITATEVKSIRVIG